MSAFKPKRSSRRSSLWQQHDMDQDKGQDEDEGLAESPLLSRSSSTPYKLYKTRGATLDNVSDNFDSTPWKDTGSYASHFPAAPSVQSKTPIRRKNASFGSPGMRASSSANLQKYRQDNASASPGPATNPSLPDTKEKHKKGRRSARFVRRKTFRQRIEELPADVVDRCVALYFSIAENLADPKLGYPIGLSLHLAALLTHLMSPTSELSLTLLAGVDPVPRRGSSLFRDNHGRRMGGSSDIRRALQQSRTDAWSWLAGIISFALVAFSVYNIYALVASRRKYRLWMRSPQDKVTSENARLVPINLDEERPGPTLHDKVISHIFRRLRSVPIVGLLVPEPPHLVGDEGPEAQIHELNVWEAPEVSLRVAVIFSPVHALLWHIAGSSFLPITGSFAWIAFFVTLVGISAQALLLSVSFSQLVKDRALLSAEVLREYDQKFVLPRAMPSVRDASTMTSDDGMEQITTSLPQSRTVFSSPSISRVRRTNAGN
ncbi:unnamed protein product [Sympodiomycopsis kandeliae]